MSLQVWYWIFMFVGLVFGLWIEYVPGQPYPYYRGGYRLIQFVLFIMLGWQVFGAPVR